MAFPAGRLGLCGGMGLTVSDLSCHRSGQPVLDRIGFDVADGCALVLRGPNGVGKSTLLRVIAGLLPAAGGRVALDGVAIEADCDGWAERIAYAGHLDAIKPQLTVAENLRFWAALHGAEVGAVGRALAAFGLAAIAERAAQVCSAGQKRRLGLARLLLVPRRLWLLDEPTVSLDVETTRRFAGLIAEHCAAGGVALIATHVDLGLPDAGEFMLVPPRSDAPVADPFLAGTMA